MNKKNENTIKLTEERESNGNNSSSGQSGSSGNSGSQTPYRDTSTYVERTESQDNIIQK